VAADVVAPASAPAHLPGARPRIEFRGVQLRAEARLPAAAAQLDLDLVRELPRLPLEAVW